MKKAAIYLKTKLKNTDYILLCAVCLLSAYGVLVVSGTVGVDSSEFATQIFGFALGLPIFIFFATVNWQSIFYGTELSLGGRKVAVFPPLLFAAYAGLLVYTLVFGIGDGNRSWLILPFYPYHFQPSELIKPLFLLTFSSHIERVGDKINRVTSLLGLALHGGSAILLVAAQGDLGSAIVFAFMFAVMLFVANVKLRWFALVGGLGAVSAPVLWSLLKEYQKMRIIYGFNPEGDPYGYGYQALVSRRVISFAGLFGDGLGGADVASIPAVENDMIFASLVAQFGIIGGIVCLALIFTVVWRICSSGRRLASAQKNTAPAQGILCAGAAAVIIVQTVESVGMCLGVIPVIGITLPLVSCGGSSLVSTLAILGMVIGCGNSAGEQSK